MCESVSAEKLAYKLSLVLQVCWKEGNKDRQQSFNPLVQELPSMNDKKYLDYYTMQRLSWHLDGYVP